MHTNILGNQRLINGCVERIQSEYQIHGSAIYKSINIIALGDTKNAGTLSEVVGGRGESANEVGGGYGSIFSNLPFLDAANAPPVVRRV